MVERSEPNAQNSEINPQAHPSGARIEKMMEDAERDRMNKRNIDEQKAAREADVERPEIEKGSSPGAEPLINSEKGIYGENLRPSEREDRLMMPPWDEPAEGGRDEIPDHVGAEVPPEPHRMNADDREARD